MVTERTGAGARGPARLALTLAIVAAASSLAEGQGQVFSPGEEVALNAICGMGRSGRTWILQPPAPSASGNPGAMWETVVPALGRTDVVSVMPGAIIPCVRVTVATDLRGLTTYELAVDAANVNAQFFLTDIHTGRVLELCPTGTPTGGGGASGAGPGALAAGKSGGFRPGHATALNALCADGRSGRSWQLAPASAGPSAAMVETIVPASGRTDVVSIMPGAIVPCVRVSVASDAAGTTYALAVDADNVNATFTISDIHTGAPLAFCAR